jgi:two-component system cell cycle sensor histidine kinase/response regulator CckA
VRRRDLSSATALLLGLNDAEEETCLSVLEQHGYRVSTRHSVRMFREKSRAFHLCLIGAESLKGKALASLQAAFPESSFFILVSTGQLEELSSRLDLVRCEILHRPLTAVELEFRLQRTSAHLVEGTRTKTLRDHPEKQDIAVLEETRRALREERDLVKSLLEVSPTFFVSFDPQRKIMMVNPKFLEATGYSREELIGKDILELFHCEDREKISALIERLITGKRPVKLESRLLSKGGGELLFDGQGKVIWNEKGRPKFTFVIGNDVTLFNKIVQTHQESVQTFRAVVENSYCSLVIMTEELSIVYANSLFQELVGRPGEDLSGLQLQMLLRENVDEETLEMLQQYTRDRFDGRSVPSIYTFKAVFRNEEIRWFETHSSVIEIPGGRKHIAAQVMDITERLWAQNELQESEVRYRSLVEAAPVGIISVDCEGRIIDVNQKLLEILGSPSAAATRAINMFTLPQLVESGITANFQRCIGTGESATFESPYRSKWGKESYLRYQITPLLKDNGRVIQVQAIIEDITEQKALEVEMIHSRKMDALSILTGGIAHEFNNLLQIIQGYAELLCLDSNSDEFGAREIRKAAQRAAELTEQLLTFSRQQDNEPERFCLNEETRKTMRLLQKGALQSVEVALDLDEGLLPISGNATQIRQMLTNLAVNARDAMAGQGRIRIETVNSRIENCPGPVRHAMRSGPFILLRFSDNGPGIDSAVLQNIFDPFFTTKNVGEGVGLGLSVVYGIVKSHGGHIECRSKPGKGTIFEIYLPANNKREKDDESIPERADSFQLCADGSQTILLVDDELTIRKLTEEYLTKFGYKVLNAADSVEAMAVFQKNYREVDLVILDLIMSPFGGERCLEEMLKLKPRQKFLFTSGSSMIKKTSEMIVAGACGFINKPFQLNELLEAVREVLTDTF